MSIDRNIAILANENYIGIGVTFDHMAPKNAKSYTYVAPVSWNLKVGDVVAVPSTRADFGIALGYVYEVDAMLRPNMDFDYKHIICQLRDDDYTERLETDKQVYTTLADAYKAQGRRSLRENITSMVGADVAASLNAVLAAKQPVLPTQTQE